MRLPSFLFHHSSKVLLMPFRLLLLTFCVSLASSHAIRADDRPNILWISCEDISSHLGCYGDPDANTPALDQLASEGVRYTHAFTCHGVCAPCRTGIITGMYPIALGANHMRSKVKLPEHVKCFPEYLRDAGYYCTNNRKTDYNLYWNEADVWDETSGNAHWKNRPNADQPFFAIFNLTMTHESRIWPENWAEVVKDLPESERHNPAKVQVSELYPDTPKVRGAIARLHDLITVMDKRVAELLRELDDAGLTDDTVVIFWSDHGDGLPRSKRWVYDSGTRVPMIARVPKKYRTSGQGQPDTVNENLINLIDLGPTVLNVAGVTVPEHMHGQAFLGANLSEPRPYIFGARDRIDERFDMVRSARDRRYRYVRTYMPWLPTLQHLQYAERSVVRQEMRRLLAENRLPKRLRHLFNPTRPHEEFYDLHNDPNELHNLAGDPKYADEMSRLKAACESWQREVTDAHIMPESMLAEEEERVESRWEVCNRNGASSRWEGIFGGTGFPVPIRRFDVQDSALRFWEMTRSDNEDDLASALTHDSPAVRVAAVRGLAGIDAEEHNDRIRDTLHALVNHPSEFVRHAVLLAIDEIPGMAEQSRDVVQSLDRSNKYIDRVAAHILGEDE